MKFILQLKYQSNNLPIIEIKDEEKNLKYKVSTKVNDWGLCYKIALPSGEDVGCIKEYCRSTKPPEVYVEGKMIGEITFRDNFIGGESKIEAFNWEIKMERTLFKTVYIIFNQDHQLVRITKIPFAFHRTYSIESKLDTLNENIMALSICVDIALAESEKVTGD